jgi:hypothetical protein
VEVGRHPRAGGGERCCGQAFFPPGEDISSAFPDLVEAWHFDATLDGELLVVRDGEVAPSTTCSSASTANA